MSKKVPKLVDTRHYHLWTDALHARALANQAKNKWDRGTYVRCTIITAWTVLEIACQDTLEEPDISYSFKENLDNAIERKSLPKLDWSQGIWQKVIEVQNIRKNYVHRFISEQNLFPEPILADRAIQVIRKAVKEIYIHSRKTPPKWIEDNEDRGWDEGDGMFCNDMVIRAGADVNDPDSIKIAYVCKDREYVTEVLPPGSDPSLSIESLIENIRIPISSIRVYRGDELTYECPLTMRGT